MRLIDADELKKSLNFVYDCAYIGSKSKEGVASDIIDEIDNAPTVDLTKNQAYDKGFITAMKLYSRPQGEWIIKPKENGQSAILICKKCNHFIPITIDKNFCPNCGADMRGKEE